MSSVKYWIWLSGLRGLRPIARNIVLEHFGSPAEAFFADDREIDALPGLKPGEAEILKNRNTDTAMSIIEACDSSGVTILTLQDAGYPSRLKNIYDPPAVLYIKGSLPTVDEEAAVAIAGTRDATPYGLKMAQRMGYELTKGGALVVSGLAAGIDSAGAYGALRAGGRCIGVLGTAIDVVYPRSNRRLFDDVAAVGALVSEFPPGAATARGNFPQRNRIISGLSVGVVIIEAPQRSGSLITADFAQEQGRDVFAVPGNADSENCLGSNGLIKSGAKAVTEGADVLLEYTGLYPNKIRLLSRAEVKIPQEQPVPKPPVEPTEAAIPPKETGADFAVLRAPAGQKEIDKENVIDYSDLEQQLEELSETQLKIVAALSEGTLPVDDIIERVQLSAGAVLSDLTILQIKGFVSQESGKRFTLKVRAKRG